ncbi:MAG: hypothetical protein ACTHN5_14455 [Phycisphaerae bacterium]
MVAGSKSAAHGSQTELTDPAAAFTDGTLVDAAIRDSLEQVRILHKKMGVPLVGSIDGKLVEISPEKIEISPESKSDN